MWLLLIKIKQNNFIKEVVEKNIPKYNSRLHLFMSGYNSLKVTMIINWY